MYAANSDDLSSVLWGQQKAETRLEKKVAYQPLSLLYEPWHIPKPDKMYKKVTGLKIIKCVFKGMAIQIKTLKVYN